MSAYALLASNPYQFLICARAMKEELNILLAIWQFVQQRWRLFNSSAKRRFSTPLCGRLLGEIFATWERNDAQTIIIVVVV